jgi:hypothetical protein
LLAWWVCPGFDGGVGGRVLWFAAHVLVRRNIWLVAGPGWRGLVLLLVVGCWCESLGWPPESPDWLVLPGFVGGLPQVAVDHVPAGMVLLGLSITRLDQPAPSDVHSNVAWTLSATPRGVQLGEFLVCRG